MNFSAARRGHASHCRPFISLHIVFTAGKILRDVAQIGPSLLFKKPISTWGFSKASRVGTPLIDYFNMPWKGTDNKLNRDHFQRMLVRHGHRIQYVSAAPQTNSERNIRLQRAYLASYYHCSTRLHGQYLKPLFLVFPSCKDCGSWRCGVSRPERIAKDGPDRFD